MTNPWKQRIHKERDKTEKRRQPLGEVDANTSASYKKATKEPKGSRGSASSSGKNFKGLKLSGITTPFRSLATGEFSGSVKLLLSPKLSRNEVEFLKDFSDAELERICRGQSAWRSEKKLLSHVSFTWLHLSNT